MPPGLPFAQVTNGGGTLEVDRAKKLTRELETTVSTLKHLSLPCWT